MSRENTSGLSPLGCALLIEPYEPEIESSSLVVPQNVRDKTAIAEARAIVVAVGPECWKSESQPRAQPGDKVMTVRYTGFMVKGPKDGKQYRMVNDIDIFCRIEE